MRRPELRTILVVDDDHDVTRVVDRVLTRNGFRVHSADSPSEALAIVRRERVQLIISDVHMPGLAGPDLLKYLRDRGIAVPVLFMSGDLSIENVERALDIPEASFLPKPFSEAELFSAVSAVIR